MEGGEAEMQSFFMASQNGWDVGWATAGQEQKEKIAP